MVLVCDDDPMIRRLLAAVLGRMNLEVVTASDGDQGLSVAKEILPDLIVSDINMPGLSGIQLAREIRRDPKLSSTPVILISSVDWEDEAMQSGCDSFIAKPFDPARLEATVGNLLGLKV